MRDFHGGRIALVLLLAAPAVACMLFEERVPGAPTAAVAASPAVAAETLPGPIALAPSLTGDPAPSSPLPEPARCPPGTNGVWSPPDAAGAPVFTCRRTTLAR